MILNLTQHSASPEQIAQGVVDLPQEMHNKIVRFLTIDELPTPGELRSRATAIALEVGSMYPRSTCMIGGAPCLMASLEKALFLHGMTPVYAFSRRESIEKHTEEGVQKVSVFRHVGFVTVEKI